MEEQRERDLEVLIESTIPFIKNRLDNVAAWVIEWMPPKDNEQHHNAVEHMLRIRQELSRIERFLVSLTETPTEAQARVLREVRARLSHTGDSPNEPHPGEDWTP